MPNPFEFNLMGWTWTAPEPPAEPDYLAFRVVEPGVKIYFSGHAAASAQYSTDGKTWTDLPSSNVTADFSTLAAGSRIRLRGSMKNPYSTIKMSAVPISGKVALEGSQQSLVDPDLDPDAVPMSADYLMYGVNADRTGLVEVSPGFSPARWRYLSYKFRGQTGLSAVPADFRFDPEPSGRPLILASIFYRCSALSSLPSGMFGENTVGSAVSAFADCAALTGTPSFTLNTTMEYGSLGSLAKNCAALEEIGEIVNFQTKCGNAVQAFAGCTSLRELPGWLKFGYAAGNFAGAFQGCTALTGIPDGFSAVGSSLSGMFSGCSSLSALPDGFFCDASDVASMFDGCSSLARFGQGVHIGDQNATTDNTGLDKTKITYIGQDFGYMPGVTWSGTYDPAVGLRTWFPNLTAEGTPSVWRCYQYQSQSIPSDYVFYWLDGGSQSETGQQMTYSGSVAQQQTSGGIQCASFPRYACAYTQDVSDLPSGDQDVTISIWYKHDNSNYSSPQMFVHLGGSGEGETLQMGVWENHWHWNILKRPYQAVFGTPDQAWHHMALRRDKTAQTITMFVDGAAASQVAVAAGALNITYGNLLINGRTVGSNSCKTLGSLCSSLRIYSRALTDAEIAALAAEFTPTT